MKIRNGFVSNSSASSFVIAKAHITEEQLKAVRTFWAERFENDETEIFYENKYYISYDLYHVCDDFFSMCKKNGIDEEKVFIEEMGH